MAIYRSGTASLDAAGKMIGTGTEWKQALSLIRTGATVIFLSGSKPVFGSIAEIISDTEINLIGTAGQTAASGDYVILLSDSLTVDGLAQDIAETLRYYQSKETAVEGIVAEIEAYLKQAEDSAAIAVTKSSEASASADAAKISETNAGQKATDAAASAGAAKQSETNAKSSENYAYDYSEKAKLSEGKAAASAQVAQEGAATVSNKANKGENNDITKLKGLVADGSTWLEEANLSSGDGEKGINLTSNNPIGVSFGTESTNGGASVFHNFTKGVAGSAAKDKAIIGGYGSRPFDGANYSGHSNAAIHFIQDGDTTPQNHGGWLRLLVTPKGKTINSRFAPFVLSNNGDTMIGKDVPFGAFNGASFLYNFTDYDGRGLKQVVNNVNEIHLVSGVTSGVNCSGNFRFNACGGSPLNPGPVQAGSGVFLSLSGFDGSSWSSAAAAVQISALTTWTPTSKPCELTFSSTPNGSVTRYNRWVIQNDGHFAPAFDNTNSIGWSQRRVTAVYATNGTIQTSDARLKTEVRDFTENELKAACAISKEIGFWKWKEKVKSEGEKARSHAGMTVQRAIEIMESFNLDPMSYGFICYDEWDAGEQVTHFDADGAEVIEKYDSGDRYSFRYDQLNLFIAKGFEARLSAIEEMMGK